VDGSEASSCSNVQAACFDAARCAPARQLRDPAFIGQLRSAMVTGPAFHAYSRVAEIDVDGCGAPEGFFFVQGITCRIALARKRRRSVSRVETLVVLISTWIAYTLVYARSHDIHPVYSVNKQQVDLHRRFPVQVMNACVRTPIRHAPGPTTRTMWSLLVHVTTRRDA
jgi:hypothetical protein